MFYFSTTVFCAPYPSNITIVSLSVPRLMLLFVVVFCFLLLLLFVFGFFVCLLFLFLILWRLKGGKIPSLKCRKHKEECPSTVVQNDMFGIHNLVPCFSYEVLGYNLWWMIRPFRVYFGS